MAKANNTRSTKTVNTKAADPQKETKSEEVLTGSAPVSKGKKVVLQEFRDVVDFSKVHKVGDDASGFTKERLAELVEAGLVGDK